MTMRSISLIGITLAAVALTASICNASDSEERIIHETYDAWVVAANEKEIVKWSTFLAQDPYFFPADSPPLATTRAVIDFYEKSFADKWFSLDCEQEHVEISDSRDMAWSRGFCHATFSGPEGERAEGKSRWFKVWIRQSDGSWKCRVNTWKYVEEP